MPAGRRRFASSRGNEVTSSQMALARVIVEDQLNELAIDFLTGAISSGVVEIFDSFYVK